MMMKVRWPSFRWFILIALATFFSHAIKAADDADRLLTRASLAAWLDDYGEAWEQRDADKAAGLFSAGSSYAVTPFDKPLAGPSGVHEYWTNVTADQRNIAFDYDILDVTGRTGIVHWTAGFETASDGTQIRLDGIFILDFTQDGKCRRLREWWHIDTGDS